MEIVKGQVVKSIAGHDKGDFQAVVRLEGDFVYVCDGKRRSLEKPKRKKLRHVAYTKTVLCEEEIMTDKKIRNALRVFNQLQDNN